jgi:AcrR family transcriptional regulator
MTATVITRVTAMVRWEPGARERLQAAALDLYLSRGFERTTAADIAQAVGLTERTFFRHFADKREVLFGSAGALRDALVEAVAAAPESLSPLETVAVGLEAAAAALPGRRDMSRRRQAIIDSNAELRERELGKFAALVEALAGALRERGLKDPAATLAAELGIAVFRVAFGRWIDEANDRALGEIVREALDEVKAFTVAEEPAARSR